ncbi:hypothetical protein DFP92_102347 [Yoonia sediminilitoris]|uniref:Uncharacterized protein n=1 Tax=Yoonia sediminilitoris TaxID=1286148 RepID=A0A2T6KM92_9RHOB|nr:hypothetical protein C8N45_102347 [Yoonia sediminilitoris]RCW97630.1 hypothetical protein DFP92_102347 [Yoonia sediminilitoris]
MLTAFREEPFSQLFGKRIATFVRGGHFFFI